MWVAMKNGGCDGSQFSSANGVCNAHNVLFDKLAEEAAGWYVPASATLFSLMISLTAASSVYAYSFQSGTFLTNFGLDCVGKSNS